MSREIKFRAWGKNFDTDVIEMTQPFDFKKYVTYSEGAQHNLLPLVGDDVVFMQFTGLKDKNGKEIYEGDIITCMQRQRFGEPKQVRGKVEYNPTLGAYEFGHKTFEEVQQFTLQVIGNIYEDPDLLEGDS